MDQSACYDIIDHMILKEKLKHIGFDTSAMSLMDKYLGNRKQYVELNTQQSDILLTGDQSVMQGSTISTLLYSIYMLDLPMITHKVKHFSHYEEYCCGQGYQTTFIDDCYGVIEGEKYDIWPKIRNYVKLMELYYTSNHLKINISKTQIMV